MSKKKQKNFIHEVITNVYNACLWVFFGFIEECADAMRDRKVDEHVIKDWVDHVNSIGCNGMFTHSEGANISLLWLPKLPITIMEYGLLVHDLPMNINMKSLMRDLILTKKRKKQELRKQLN